MISESIKLIFVIIQLVTSLGLTVESIDVHGYKQQIYTVVANPVQTKLIQKLSKDQLYGFETLSEMDDQNAYDIGVNGMFYSDMGKPAGIVINNGELIAKQSIGTPLFVLGIENKPDLIEAELEVYLEYNDKEYKIENMNQDILADEAGIFTSWYGKHDRLRYEHIAVIVEKGRVADIILSDAPVQIPGETVNLNENDFVLCYSGAELFSNVQIGDEMVVKIKADFDYEKTKQGFQTGGWLVNNGENIAKDFESYLGPTNSMQPRTAIGITDDKKIVIKVVDGRNKGVSEGVTGKWLADLMIEEGCIKAGYLDGGASTTLINSSEVINQPSLGEEKGISHGLFFEVNQPK